MNRFAVCCLVLVCLAGCQDARVIPNGASNRPGVSALDEAQRSTGDSAAKSVATTEEGPGLKDEDITAKIREQMMKTDMSINVQGIKIVTQDGKVILRGVVKTAEEKQLIEKIAQNIAGSNNVANWLETE